MAGGALEGGGEAEHLWNKYRGLSAAPLRGFGRDDRVVGWREDFELDLAGFAVAGFDGVDEAGADVGREGEAVGEDEDGTRGFVRARGCGEVELEEGFGCGEFDYFSIADGSATLRGGVSVGLPEAVVAAAAEFGEAFFECVGEIEGWGGFFFLCRFFCCALGFGFGCDFFRGDGGALHRLELDVALLDREEGVDAGGFRQREDAGDDFVDGVPANGAAAVEAGDGAAACVEKAEVVVDFGGGGDGGARVASLIFLLDGDGGREAVHEVDVGLLDALEELTRVGGEGFDVAALAFGIDGIKGQRGFAGARDTRDDC